MFMVLLPTLLNYINIETLLYTITVTGSLFFTPINSITFIEILGLYIHHKWTQNPLLRTKQTLLFVSYYPIQ